MSKINPVFWYLKFLELRLLKSASKIISLLPGAYAYLEENGVDKQKIFYLPNGIDVDLYPEEILKPSFNGDFNAMYFGAHGPANNLENLIQAAKILKDKKVFNINLILIGDGVTKPNLIKLTNQNNLTNVQFLDTIPKRKLFQKVSEASCFISTLNILRYLSFMA